MDAVEPLGAALKHVKQKLLEKEKEEEEEEEEEEGPLESVLELGPTSLKEEPHRYCLELVPVIKAEPETRVRNVTFKIKTITITITRLHNVAITVTITFLQKCNVFIYEYFVKCRNNYVTNVSLMTVNNHFVKVWTT
jgi:hypothetical protein